MKASFQFVSSTALSSVEIDSSKVRQVAITFRSNPEKVYHFRTSNLLCAVTAFSVAELHSTGSAGKTFHELKNGGHLESTSHWSDEPLTGTQLVNEAKKLHSAGVSINEIILRCGYITTRKNGQEKAAFTSYYENLIRAQHQGRTKNNLHKIHHKLIRTILEKKEWKTELLKIRYYHDLGHGWGDYSSVMLNQNGRWVLIALVYHEHQEVHITPRGYHDRPRMMLNRINCIAGYFAGEEYKLRNDVISNIYDVQDAEPQHIYKHKIIN
jgi:hypothetical protein